MKKKKSLAAKLGPYGYILPSLLIFAVFLFYPF
ncbi:MAG: sugar ABC transporter permease, partial [Lachnospiraceae bacterium]